MKGKGLLLTEILLAAGLGMVAALVGCESGFDLDDPFSPRADFFIQSFSPSAVRPIVGSIEGTSEDDAQTTTDFPEVVFTLGITNGVGVSVQSFSVIFSESDGLTPLGLPVHRGSVSRFIPGGISPGTNAFSQTNSPVTTFADQALDIMPRANIGTAFTTFLNFLNAGGGRQFIANVTVFGTDSNGNNVRASAQVPIIPVPRIAPASGGGSETTT